jgi:hypothetical protein
MSNHVCDVQPLIFHRDLQSYENMCCVRAAERSPSGARSSKRSAAAARHLHGVVGRHRRELSGN